MQVVFAPHWGFKNPYPGLLAGALGKLGVRVRFVEGEGSRFRQLGLPPEREPYDVLHLHFPSSYILGRTPINSFLRGASLVAELKRRQARGIRVVWTVHNLVNDNLRHRRIERFWTRRVAELADHLIVHSDYARQEVVRVFGVAVHKVSVVPHGHYADCYPRSLSRSEAREKLGIPQDNLVFLFFGRIGDRKGLAELLQAFRRLPDHKVNLLIAGSPATQGWVRYIDSQQRQDPRIRSSLRQIEDEELQVYMHASDVYVAPFRFAFTSGSVIAAMSFGRAVIAPAIGAVTSVVSEEGGLLYDPNNDRGLEEMLRKARAVDLDAMGQRNLTHIYQFDWDQIALRTKAVYEVRAPHYASTK